MIRRYTDHAANERTYLAWIRTAVTIMAFGFLIEKFDLFVSYIGIHIGDENHFHTSLSAAVVGFVLFLVAGMIIVSATVRFFIYKKSIESAKIFPYNIQKTNILLSILMVLLAVFLIVYIGHHVMGWSS